MKRLKSSLSAVLATLLMAAAHGQTRLAQTRLFQGAWFSVRYPVTFRVSPSQRSATGPGYDSAFFTAPDRSVQFYVFSPQWNGEPRDCQLDSRREVLVDEHVEVGRRPHGTTTARQVTVRARDRSYERSWVDMATPENTRLVFGIRYRNAAALKAYRPQYLAFKKSLAQSAD